MKTLSPANQAFVIAEKSGLFRRTQPLRRINFLLGDGSRPPGVPMTKAPHRN